ncbi:MAG: hypothetical protein QF662_02360 [Phycisphaerae bacterium]|nr:hypothetical protein [Phycisphaerae bacterium]
MTGDGPLFRDLEPQLDRKTDVEYAAVSMAAVFAVIIGALGPLALLIAFIASFEYWLLNLVPLAAAALALVALARIRRSEGTLAGRRLALAGLGLGAVFLLAGLILHTQYHFAQREQKADVLRIAQAQCDDLVAGEPGPIYDRLGEEFRAQGTREAFVKHFSRVAEIAGEIHSRRVFTLRLYHNKGLVTGKAHIRLDGKKQGIDVVVWAERDDAGLWRPTAFSANLVHQQ